MALPVNLCGPTVIVTGTGNISPAAGTQPVAMLGFYVNSTTNGTLVFRSGGSGGTAISGTITPAIGWHFYPVIVDPPLHVTVGNTINITVVLSSAA